MYLSSVAEPVQFELDPAPDPGSDLVQKRVRSPSDPKRPDSDPDPGHLELDPDPCIKKKAGSGSATLYLSNLLS